MKYLTKNKYWNIVEEYNLEKLLYLLIDRPNIVNGYNSFIWLNNKNQQHRNYDLPSFASITDQYFCWYLNSGTAHRENNKPALIYYDGTKKYFINGKLIKEEHEISNNK